MRLIRAIVLAGSVSLSLLGSAGLANANDDSTAAVLGSYAPAEQIDPGDPGLPPDQ